MASDRAELRAYHGDPAVKAKYLDRMRGHVAADRLIQGTGWDGHRGCAVGCTLERYNHAAFETELGIPVAVARLVDGIFEDLPWRDESLAMDASRWPVSVLESIPIGADLSDAVDRFLYWLLTTTDPAVDLSTRADARGRAAIAVVARLFARRLAGDEPSQKEWSEARSEADAAAMDTAESAARSAAESAARSAAESAWFAADATRSDARSVWSAFAARFLVILRGEDHPIRAAAGLDTPATEGE